MVYFITLNFGKSTFSNDQLQKQKKYFQSQIPLKVNQKNQMLLLRLKKFCQRSYFPPTAFRQMLKYNYHMSYLMDSKHDDRYVKIDRRLFHLYKDMILSFPQKKFNQKIFLIVLIDCVRTKQKYEFFEQLADFGLDRIQQFQEPLSIFSFSTQLYLYNYLKKEKCEKLALKGFEFFRLNPTLKYSSYYVMKFLIFIQKNVGLHKFSDEQYSLINFKRFKPLFLCFTLEMFFQNNLEHYQTIKYLFELFTSSQSIIPFADIHHYKLATKKITEPRFKNFVERLNKRLIEERKYNNKDDQSMDENENQQDLITRKKQQFDLLERNLDLVENLQKKWSQEQGFEWQKAYVKQIQRRYNLYQSILYNSSSSNKQQVQE